MIFMMSTYTLRRHYIDEILSSTAFYGKVLDVGGKKTKKRGFFRPPLEKVESWEYLNTDPSTNPDYCCAAEGIAVPADSFDIVLMTEVLEHLERPEVAIKECCRVLKRGGKLIMTIPFLYPVHADPHDFQRWTSERISLELTKNGFRVDSIEPMGSLFSVIYDLIYVALVGAAKDCKALKNRIGIRFFMPLIRGLFISLDRKYEYKANKITTGYHVIGWKSDIE
jgi:SAM-dependent methyltransferase